jgi:hypothetical protein
MRRQAALRALAVGSAVIVAAAPLTPAGASVAPPDSGARSVTAGGGRGRHDGGRRGEGRRLVGLIDTFDGSTLDVTARDGTHLSFAVAADVQVKLEHRGNHAHGRGHGNPSRGSADDLVAGAEILRVKLDRGGTIDKIRLRSTPASLDSFGGAGDDETAQDDLASSEATAQDDEAGDSLEADATSDDSGEASDPTDVSGDVIDPGDDSATLGE